MPSPTSSSFVTASFLTGETNVDALLGGLEWASGTITYSFPNGTATHDPDYAEPDLWTRWSPLSTTQQSAVTNALTAWSHVANLQFSRSVDTSTTVGDIRVAFSSSFDWGSSVAQAYFPNATPAGGDVWIDPSARDVVGGQTAGSLLSSSFSPGSFAYYVLLHELGHALGLKHPFSGVERNPTVIDPAYDSRMYTLMSYTALAETPGALGYTYNPTTPMLLDIQAIQSMYGVNTSYNAGDTTYSFNDDFGQIYFQTIWDGGGVNAIVYRGNTASVIDLHQGAGSTIGNRVYAYSATNPRAYTMENVWIAYGTHILTATVTGSGNNTLIANDEGNILTGGSGNDTLTGGAGNDVLVGGGGNDTIEGGAAFDWANYAGNRAGYTITTSGSIVTVRDLGGNEGTDTLTGVERLRFADRGMAFDVDGTGGQAYRLYQAAFNRTPDMGGLGYWITQMDQGGSLETVASFFNHSAEFQSLYGTNPDGSTYVNLLYQNVLHRAPDQGGFNYWTSELATRHIDFTGLLMYFSESPENHTQTATALANGIQYLFYAG